VGRVGFREGGATLLIMRIGGEGCVKKTIFWGVKHGGERKEEETRGKLGMPQKRRS